MKIVINPTYQSFEPLFRDIQTYFTNSTDIIHKERNVLKKVTYSNKILVIKAFKKPHFFNRVIYTYFRDSKAKRSYRNALRLIELDISTPIPIGYLEKKSCGLLKESYYVCEKVDYKLTMREARKVKEAKLIFKQFAAFAYSLHQKGVFHKDLSLGNILIKKRKEMYDFTLVDLNRMKFKKVSFKEGLKNFSRLWLTNEDAGFLGSEYAKISGRTEDEGARLLEMFNKKFKSKKIFKDKIRGKR